MSGIDVDDVKTCVPGTKRRVPMPATQVAYILLVHGPGLIGMAGYVWHATNTQRYFPRQQVRCTSTACP